MWNRFPAVAQEGFVHLWQMVPLAGEVQEKRGRRGDQSCEPQKVFFELFLVGDVELESVFDEREKHFTRRERQETDCRSRRVRFGQKIKTLERHGAVCMW